MASFSFRSGKNKPTKGPAPIAHPFLARSHSPKDIANLKNEIEKRQKETPDNASQPQTETVVVDKASDGATTTQGEQLASS
jgi:hypothetical protein